MAKLPKNVCEAWDDRDGAIVLSTVDGEGVPNSIYATCVSRFDDETLVVADNYFDKTRKNISKGGRGSLLFITKAGKSFQVKGKIEYHDNGPIFDDMKAWNPEKHPGHAAAALKVEEVYSGAEKLL
ncbi:MULTISPECIES: pyridoxamine 5'-phosphate oxidase family protein [Dethiosulfovibrio]|jgi:predicted pyridoxine 5'-phosphate oxidase superfamily flavin-nucleotide-binding protein|uniref:Pyridoxamine 5'-phosphate oxidase family protein n=2 Tax=Dethiosulfovibrio TaxID=47054 RepID=A0ABS9EN57_9BACT|nr:MULTISPECIES: pyridoxamine 5'-phosphate oxidase family protein [Dethiosulfovibrio]MCF4112779.1 pyridoxamine 5'-phosphate oxidase family protein [Dethiosulfovibrio russensis]MCF4141243.1 pyridoxamine 5'-phosphate oxidase family protein [Dethiosulfovibrio marinus]MCF4144929.1 pyridoxamine 5'-phosphate oxidase family protein [Dethiosulfovibrio acidaminovorans]